MPPLPLAARARPSCRTCAVSRQITARVHARMRMRACVCVRARARMRACVRACVRACRRVCVHARTQARMRARIGTSVRAHMCGLHAHPHEAYLRAACAWAHGRMNALVGGVAPAQHRLQCDRRSPPRRMRMPAEHAAHTCLHTRRVCERVRPRLCGRGCASDACTALRIGLSSDSRQRRFCASVRTEYPEYREYQQSLSARSRRAEAIRV